MKEYIKPRLVVYNLTIEGLLNFAVSGEGDGSDALSKRGDHRIIEDDEE